MPVGLIIVVSVIWLISSQDTNNRWGFRFQLILTMQHLSLLGLFVIMTLADLSLKAIMERNDGILILAGFSIAAFAQIVAWWSVLGQANEMGKKGILH